MGYSIATPIKSQKAKARMQVFLAEHYRPLSEIVVNPRVCHPDYDDSRWLTDDLAYDDGACRLGFNYGATDEVCRHYMMSILTWMALRVGKIRRFKKLSRGYSAPYYVYDGHEAYPVLDASLWQNRFEPGVIFVKGDPPRPKQQDKLEVGVFRVIQGENSVHVVTVDSMGYRSGLSRGPWWVRIAQEMVQDVSGLEKTIRDEILRLTELWDGHMAG